MRSVPPRASRAVAALFVAPLLASPVKAQSACGSETTVAAGETLAEVAERCGVSLGELFDANPDLRSTEVAAGTQIDVPGISGGSILDRTRDAIREAGREVEGAATRAGKSVSNYLSENPDLNRDILEFGERLGLPGLEASPETGADLAVAPKAGKPGDMVLVQASGLRGDTEAIISAGPPNSKFQVLQRAKTNAAGRLEVRVEIPQWAATAQPLIFVVETDRVRVNSEPFTVNPE